MNLNHAPQRTVAEKPTVKLLIVDDNSEDRETYKRLVRNSKEAEFSFLESDTGEKGLDLCLREKPDCVLLDYILPDTDGLEFIASLKEMSRALPVIMLTGQGDETVAVLAMKEGAEDYLVKEHITSSLLKTTIFKSLRYNGKGRNGPHPQGARPSPSNGEPESNDTPTNEKALISEIQFLKKKLEQGTSDPVTGLPNRNGMTEKLHSERVRYERNRMPFSMIVADIDDFALLQAKHGPETADGILVQVADILKNSCRELDMVGRWDGERFLILLPETNMEGGSVLAEKYCQQIESQKFVFKKQEIPLSMSFRVGVFDDPRLKMEDCIQQMDVRFH